MPDHAPNAPALSGDCLHLCIDMQNIFAEGSDWHTPWMKRVLPAVERLVERHPDRCLFTRFIPAERVGDGEGTWRDYYERWPQMTLERLPPGATDLLPALARFVPPALVLDKPVYSPWFDGRLEAILRQRGARSLIISGAETDVCVLAAVLGAVDRGFHVVIPADALCSSSDRMHDALLSLYTARYGTQVEVASVDGILQRWSA